MWDRHARAEPCLLRGVAARFRPYLREPARSCPIRSPRALDVPYLISPLSFSLVPRRRHGSQVLSCKETRFSATIRDIVEKAGDETRQQKTEPTHRQKHLSGDDSGRPARTIHLSNPPDPLRARYGPTIFDTFILRCLVPSTVSRDALHYSRRSRMGGGEC